MERLKNRPILNCVGIFTVCAAARIIEYFIIRTDETILAENFLHKLFGIIFLAAILKILKSSWADIGFVQRKAVPNTCKGLLLGFGCFLIAYSVECSILYFMNKEVHLAFYASGFR